MRRIRLAATAVCALVAVGVGAGTVAAEPVSSPGHTIDSATLVHGNEHGIGYTLRYTEGESVRTTLDGGVFRVVEAGVVIEDEAGTVVTTLPLVFPARDRLVTLEPIVEADGKSLTLRAIDEPFPGQDTRSAQERWHAEAERAAFGALIGAGIGLAIGLFGGIIGIPLFTAVGAAIGFFVVGGQPLIDAGLAYFGGQP